MAKITEYTQTTSFDSNDVLLKDGTGGTKIISVEDAAIEFAGSVSAINHRCNFRGKNLGTSVTATQMAAVADGSFDDLFIGDYWVIDGFNWRIWDMNYWLYTGDTSFTKYHLVIVPDTCLYDAQMNDTDITTGGYVGSQMYTTNLESAKTIISGIFGSYLLTHRNGFTNATTSGYPSGYIFADSTVDLMNEHNVYGSRIYSPGNHLGLTLPTLYTMDKKIFMLALIAPQYVNIRYTYWLRDVVSAYGFASVDNRGDSYYISASSSRGVRPCFAIGG